MKNPAHPGRLVASAIEAEGWTVTHAAERLGVTRAFLSRIRPRALLHPRAQPLDRLEPDE